MCKSDVEKIYQYLEDAKIYYLATVEQDHPWVRPFSTVNVFEGKLYLLTGKKKGVFEQFTKNPHVQIAVMGKDGTWIQLTGILKYDQRIEPLKAMEEKYPDFADKYNKDTESENAVFFFEEGTAIVSSYRTEPVTWKL